MTLTNRRDDEEQIDPRVVAAIRAATRAEQDDEYEASTPAAGRWRERTERNWNLAQRHRYGHALDQPPRNDLDEGGWLAWWVVIVVVVVVAWVGLAVWELA